MEFIKTHMDVLDEALCGGVIAGSSFMISGPGNSGKSTLAMQIQYNHLSMNHGCGIYVSYTQPFNEICDAFMSHGWDVEPFMKSGHFQIVDVHSTITGIASQHVLSPAHRKGVVFLDYVDYHDYFKRVGEVVRNIKERTGKPNVDVVDSCSYALRHAQTSRREKQPPWKGVMTYYQSLREKLAAPPGGVKGCGLHIFRSDETNRDLADALDEIEHGHIELHLDNLRPQPRRFLTTRVRTGTHQSDRFYYTIAKEGITFLDSSTNE